MDTKRKEKLSKLKEIINTYGTIADALKQSDEKQVSEILDTVSFFMKPSEYGSGYETYSLIKYNPEKEEVLLNSIAGDPEELYHTDMDWLSASSLENIILENLEEYERKDVFEEKDSKTI